MRLQILITNFGTNTKQASIGNSQNVVVDVYKGSRLWRYDKEKKKHFENETRTKPLFTHSVTQNVTHASLMILIASLIVEFTMSLITTYLNHSLFHSHCYSRVTRVTRLIYNVTNSTTHDITDSVTHGITPNVLLNATH